MVKAIHALVVPTVPSTSPLLNVSNGGLAISKKLIEIKNRVGIAINM